MPTRPCDQDKFAVDEREACVSESFSRTSRMGQRKRPALKFGLWQFRVRLMHSRECFHLNRPPVSAARDNPDAATFHGTCDAASANVAPESSTDISFGPARTSRIATATATTIAPLPHRKKISVLGTAKRRFGEVSIHRTSDSGQ